MGSELDARALAAARRTMVERQIRPSDVTRPDLIAAFLETPREAYLPKSRRAQAYVGEHIPVSAGRWELDPRVFAKLLSALEPAETDLALVVGSGGGYAAAILSRLTAAVVALETDESLAALADASDTPDRRDNIVAHAGPLETGAAEHAPYNLILVNGAIARAAPAAWTDQLADGGRLGVIVMSGASGRAEIHIKSGDAIGARPVFDASAPILPGFEPEAGFEF